MNIKSIGWEIVDWNNMVQDREKWRAFVNVVM